MLTGLFILQLTGSDRSLMNAFREIGVMADRINLPRKIQVSNLDIIEYNGIYKMLKLLQNAITYFAQVYVIRKLHCFYKMQRNRAGLRHVRCSFSGMIRINFMTKDYSDWP